MSTPIVSRVVWRDHGDPEIGGHTTDGGAVSGVTRLTYVECERYKCPAVAVINPEDAEHAERLDRAIREAYSEVDVRTLPADHTATMQAALRSLVIVADPEPDEPQNDGALVECDYDGKHGRAVRLGGGWMFYGEALRDYGAMYDDFTAITVLSEGVRP